MFKEVVDKFLRNNVNEYTEKKNGLTYLSWANAWEEVLKTYPTATYTIKKNEDGQCWFGNSKLGFMVYTSVEIGGVTHEMWLPVMDNSNKAMKEDPYTYEVKDWNESKKQGKDIFKTKTVEAVSTFDINKAVMRCLVKNLAMFGLGLYIYKGEDLPSLVPTNIDCKDIIEVGFTKNYKATELEKLVRKKYGYGMEFITQSQHDEILLGLQQAEKK